MSAKPQGFGFRPEESEPHSVVTVPGGSRGDVLIAEHLRFDPAAGHAPPSLGVGAQDVKLRVALPRANVGKSEAVQGRIVSAWRST